MESQASAFNHYTTRTQPAKNSLSAKNVAKVVGVASSEGFLHCVSKKCHFVLLEL